MEKLQYLKTTFTVLAKQLIARYHKLQLHIKVAFLCASHTTQSFVSCISKHLQDSRVKTFMPACLDSLGGLFKKKKNTIPK